MRSSSLLAAASAAVASVIAVPFTFPLPDGFPNPTPDQLAIIQQEAGGPLPNGPLPTSLKSTGVTTLQLLATNELFEVAYFSQLLTNVTNNVTGYDVKSIAPLERSYVIDTLTAVVNVSREKNPLPPHLSKTLILSNPARKTSRSRCKRRPPIRLPTRHPALRIPIPRHELHPSHHPCPNLHRRRPRHLTRSPSRLRRRRRRRVRPRANLRLRARPGRGAERLLSPRAEKDTLRRTLLDRWLAQLRVHGHPDVHRARFLPAATVKYQSHHVRSVDCGHDA